MQFCVALNNIYILGQTNFSTILNIILQTCFKHLCSWKLMAANWMAKLLLKHFFNGVEKYCFSCRQAAPFHPLSWISDWVSQSSSVGVSECSSCISFRMRRIAIESASSAATKKRLRQPGQLAPTMQDYTLDKWMLEKWWLLFDCCYEQRPFLSSFFVHI